MRLHCKVVAIYDHSTFTDKHPRATIQVVEADGIQNTFRIPFVPGSDFTLGHEFVLETETTRE